MINTWIGLYIFGTSIFKFFPFVIYLKRERERECRNWKDDLVIAIEMRERESVCVCGGILFWKGDLVIAIEMRERERERERD